MRGTSGPRRAAQYRPGIREKQERRGPDGQMEGVAHGGPGIDFAKKVLAFGADADYKRMTMSNAAAQVLCSRRKSSGMFVCLWITTYAPRARNGPR